MSARGGGALPSYCARAGGGASRREEVGAGRKDWPCPVTRPAGKPGRCPAPLQPSPRGPSTDVRATAGGGTRPARTLVRIWPDVDTLRMSFCGPSCSPSLSDDSSPGPAAAAATAGCCCWMPAPLTPASAPAIFPHSCRDTAHESGSARAAAAATPLPGGEEEEEAAATEDEGGAGRGGEEPGAGAAGTALRPPPSSAAPTCGAPRAAWARETPGEEEAGRGGQSRQGFPNFSLARPDRRPLIVSVGPCSHPTRSRCLPTVWEPLDEVFLRGHSPAGGLGQSQGARLW